MGKDTESDKMSLGYAMLYGLMKPLAMLPLPLLYVFSDMAYLAVYRIAGYRRKTVAGNLRLAFPDMTDEERKKIEKRFYHHLCDTMIEAVKLLHMSDREADRRIQVRNAGIVDGYINAGRSVVLFLGHYGNWEWVPAITRHFSSEAMMGELYKPQRNKAVDRLLLKIRSRFNTVNIPMQRAVRFLLGCEREGRKFVIGFISDQRPIARELHHWTDFMGIDTPYMVGGETIGDRINAAYVYVDVEKPSRGHYILTFREVEPDANDNEPYRNTRRFMQMLEQSIRRDPGLWLWSHKRWKKRRRI